METHARYLLIGASSLVVTAGLILFALWLGKLQLDRDWLEYEVRFRESVAGLTVGGIVQYQGVQVGEVRRLSLDPQDPGEVEVRIRVAADTPIKTDTQAQLAYTGLTGVAVVELLGGSADAPLLREVAAAAVPRIESIPSSLSQLMSGGRGAVRSAEDVLERISRVLTDENVERVSSLLANIDAMGAAAREDYPKLRAALVDLNALQVRLDSIAARTDALLAQAQSGLAAPAGGEQGDAFKEFADAIVEVRAAAAALRRASTAAARSVDGFERDGADDLALALRELRETAQNLSRITRDFERSPADYLLGGDSLPVYPRETER